MVALSALWLPIVLSAVAVFIASSLIHMVIGWHNDDYGKLPDETSVRAAMRDSGLRPGDYAFPCPKSMKEMGSPEMVEKFNEGPVGLMTVRPNGPPAIGKALALWFIYSIVIGVFAAYVAGRTLGPGADYLTVFRVVGTVTFLGYSGAHFADSIWKGTAWLSTAKHILDGLIYGLLTAGVFGWLWP